MKIILASSSPRRRELLKLIGLEPEIIVPAVEEELKPAESKEDFIKRVCLEKGRFVYKEEFYNVPVVSSATIVCINDTILGKPAHRQAAFNMLKTLSGKKHEVITGLSILYKGENYFDSAVTQVYFTALSGAEIDFYLDKKEYADKAGAYGIQGKASVFVERIEGCYFNVMGFPLSLFYKMLKKIGLEIYS